MPKIAFIIFVLISVWQLINSMIEKAAKKKEQEPHSSLVQSRQGRRDVPANPPTAKPGGSTPFAQQAQNPKARNRKEELAAQRQAQLEELRRRRAGQSSVAKPRGPSSGQVRIGNPTASGSPAPTMRPGLTPQQASPQIITQKADPKSIQLDRDRQLQQKRQAQVARQQASKVADHAEEQRHSLNDARIRAERETFHREAQAGLRGNKGAKGGSLKTAYSEKTEFTSITRTSILAHVKNRQSLRELFILKELLDPPLAMRPPSE